MNSRQGFTLLELIIAMFVSTIVVAAMSAMFIYFVNSYNFTFEQNLTISDVKIAFGRLPSELRETQTSEDGAYPLFVVNDNELGFYADIDNDERIERVRYYLDGTDFYKAVLEPNDTQTPYSDTEDIQLISSVVVNTGNPVFHYYNGDWPGDVINNPLPQSERLLSTRLIDISLEINTAVGQQENFEVSTQVMLRNLKSN